MVTVTVRGVDKGAWKAFKAKAAVSDLPLGKALTLVASAWSSKKRNSVNFFDLEPEEFKGDAKNLSKIVDRVLYA